LTDTSPPFQILSIDGGGIRGMFAAAVLAHLEKDLETRIADHFDLITGTSTGGIIALALGLGMPPAEILEFYLTHGRAIFPQGLRGHLRSLLHWGFRKHNPTPLESALRECFGDRLLGHSSKRVVIPTFNMDGNDVRLFKTAHHERLRRDHKIPVWQIAMATTAAPTYLPGFLGIDRQWLIDGGVWANNPTMVGLTEATGVLGIPFESVSILNIGTLSNLPKRSRFLITGGKLPWARHIADFLTSAQSTGVVNQARLILGEERVIRIDSSVPAGLLSLDRYAPDELISRASRDSQHITPIIAEKLIPHISPTFVPCHATEGGAQ